MPRGKERWSIIEQDDTLYIITPSLHGDRQARATLGKMKLLLKKEGATQKEIRAFKRTERHERAHL